LDHHRTRLTEDHAKAKAIGKVLQNMDYVAEVQPIETNIVIFELANHVDAEEFITNLKLKNILISNMGGGKLRMVTHLDYTDTMHKNLLETLVSIL
jgi:threonine aldolase